MADRCRLTRNSVSLQADLFRLAERDHGLSLTVLARKTEIPRATLRDWASGAVMPAWGLFKLGCDGGVPDELLSMLAEPFGYCVGLAEDEDGSGDAELDDAALAANDLVGAVTAARHPRSPGGMTIVPQERAPIEDCARRVAASARRVIER